jgi:hypothetical protein
MTSKGWIKLNNFKIPLTRRIKLKMARYVFLGRIKTSYQYNTDSVLITAEFRGDKLGRVINELSELLKEWEKQNIQT